MRKRSNPFKKMLIPLMIILLLICIIFGITFLYAPSYILLEGGIMLLLGSATSFYAGNMQMRAAKMMGKPVPWWKQASIISALYYGCFGALVCFAWFYLYRGFAHHELDNPIGISILVLALLLIFGLVIYGSILSFLSIKATKKTLAEMQARRVK